MKYTKFYSLGGWLLFVAVLLSLTIQCNGPTPSLPTTPTAPVVRIALLTPTSGELDTVGRMLRNGIIMAFDEWNEQGGVLDHRIEWLTYNTDCTFEGGQQAAQKAIAAEHQFIIGPLCSEAAIAAASVIESTEAVLIVPAAPHPLVTVDYQGRVRPSVFGVSYGPEWQGEAAARFAYDLLQVDKVAVLTQTGNNYISPLSQAFAQTFTSMGGEIVHQATYKHDHVDFSEMLQAIDQAGAELIYLPAEAGVVNRLAQQLQTLNLYQTSSSTATGLLLLGSDAWESPQLERNNLIGSYFPTHFQPNEKNQPWADHYKATYSITPNTLAALGYDSATMLLQAINQADTFNPVKVITTLEQGTFDGVIGPTNFTANHTPHKPILFLQITEDEMLSIIAIEP